MHHKVAVEEAEQQLADQRVPKGSSVSNVFQSLNEYVGGGGGGAGGGGGGVGGEEKKIGQTTLAKLQRYAPDEEEDLVEVVQEEKPIILTGNNGKIEQDVKDEKEEQQEETDHSAGSSGSPLLLSGDENPGDRRCYDNPSNTSSSTLPSPTSTTSSSSSTSTPAIDPPTPSNLYQNQVNDDEDDEHPVPIPSLSIDQLHPEDSPKEEQILQLKVASSQPIGFEATMDDVSDTELESYLLDLELESSSAGGGTNVQADVAAELAQPQSPQNPQNPQNADSFSQASTVEFGPQDEPEAPIVHVAGEDDPKEAMIMIEDQRTLDQHQAYEMPMQTKPKKTKHRKSSPPTVSAVIPSVCAADQTPSEQAPPPPVQEPTEAVEEPVAFSHPPPPPPPCLPIPEETTVIQMSTSSSEEFDPELPSTSSSHHQEPHQQQLGLIPPYWIPDAEAATCMRCQLRFSLIKRRHHCRGCGHVLCSGCCSLKAKLPYMGGEAPEARVCVACDTQLRQQEVGQEAQPTSSTSSHRPNPNNPMEYCSQISPLLQVGGGGGASGGSGVLGGGRPGASVMVPVGVLKRPKAQSGTGKPPKTVMFSDGIRPGCDLTDLDNNWDRPRVPATSSSTLQTPPEAAPSTTSPQQPPPPKTNIQLPAIDPNTESYIGQDLPPVCELQGTVGDVRYLDVTNDQALLQRLHKETLRFAIHRNLYVLVRIVTRESFSSFDYSVFFFIRSFAPPTVSCCINKTVINYTTEGMRLVGQDEIVVLLETGDEDHRLPRDIFLHLNDVYRAADQGTTVGELGFSMAGGGGGPGVDHHNNIPSTSSSSYSSSSTTSTSFLGHKEHGGFLYVRPTFQCLQSLIVPADRPFLIAILIHRWEVPWAKIFPLRLMLRLGALYRYYPCPHVSVRGRDSVYAEIAQTIINLLADFRTYSYTLAAVRGLRIHMEDRTTHVLVPRNRYDQVQQALANSSDHILALAGNFSPAADGHLVCIQNTDAAGTGSETHSYATQAVNIQGRPRRVTGASFLLLNGALKSASGLSAKCSIVEDGLMVQVMPAKMVAVQKALRDMRDVEIVCGPVDGAAGQTEVVSVRWVENDVDFNVG